MLSSIDRTRFGDRTVLFDATTTIFDYGALNASFNANVPMTLMALIRPTGSGEGTFGYVLAKTDTNLSTGTRWFVDHNSGAPKMAFGQASGDNNPLRGAPNNSITYGKWVWVAVTSLGTITATDIKLYQGEDNIKEVSSYSTSNSGTGTINNSSTYKWIVGNRDGSDRTFAGDIAVAIRWNDILSLENMNEVLRVGPMSVKRDKQIFCWMGGHDFGPRRLHPVTVTGRGMGRPKKYPMERVEHPSWFAEVAGGLSAVQKDSDLRWDVIAAAMKDADFRWNILSSATKDVDLRWALLNAAQKDADFRWDIVSALQKDVDLRWDLISAILKDIDIRWDIESSSTVVKDIDIRWSLLASLLKDADFRWNVLNAVQKDSSLIWNLLAMVSKDVDLRWDVLSSLTSINKDIDIRWNLVASAVKDLSAQWDVLTSVSKDETLIWNIAIAAVRDIDLRWDISAGLGAVTKDSTFMWAVINAAQKDITLQWVIQTVAGPEIKSRYIYVLPEEGRVFVLRPENFH